MPSPRFPIPQGIMSMRLAMHCSRSSGVVSTSTRAPLYEMTTDGRVRLSFRFGLEQISQSVVQVNQGSLYPALHRLEQKKWVQAEWKQSETGREARFYSLTRSGRKQLGIEKDSWARLSSAVQLIFDEGNR